MILCDDTYSHDKNYACTKKERIYRGINIHNIYLRVNACINMILKIIIIVWTLCRTVDTWWIWKRHKVKWGWYVPIKEDSYQYTFGTFYCVLMIVLFWDSTNLKWPELTWYSPAITPLLKRNTALTHFIWCFNDHCTCLVSCPVLFFSRYCKAKMSKPLFASLHMEQKHSVPVLHGDIDLALGGQELRGQALLVSEGRIEWRDRPVLSALRTAEHHVLTQRLNVCILCRPLNVSHTVKTEDKNSSLDEKFQGPRGCTRDTHWSCFARTVKGLKVCTAVM